MTRVLVLTRYDHMGASSRVRFLQYVPHLARCGLEIEVQRLFSNDALARLYRDGKRSPFELAGALAKRLAAVMQKSRADVIWLQQEIFPFLPAFTEMLLLAGRPVVIDFDDATHLYYQDKPWPVPALYGEKIARLMRRASAVVVGSDTMGDYARAAGAANVHLVYSAVDTNRFANTAPCGAGTNEAGGFRVGWIGTPMTAAQSLDVLREPLKQFLAETESQCTLMGVMDDQFSDIPAKRIPWSEGAEPAFLGEIDVGLCPLDDSPWTRGKSGYKIIQYFSAGRPALASPVGIAAQLVEEGRTGFQCRTAEDWYKALRTLHRHPVLCAAMGAAARARAEERYDIHVAAEALYKFSRQLISHFSVS